MKDQQYSNHVRYYTPHHFIFYPLILTMLGISIKYMMADDGQQRIWMLMAALCFMIGWLSFLMRQHYALTCQNRIVRLELRFRYYQLTQQRLEPFEEKLSFGQLAALRFASDEEFVPLLQRAVKENLSPAAIKKLIKNWVPDHMRV